LVGRTHRSAADPLVGLLSQGLPNGMRYAPTKSFGFPPGAVIIHV
jgi:hypothetical protein